MICRSKLHDDESSMSQVFLMMTKEPKRMISRMSQQVQDQDWFNDSRKDIKKNKDEFKIQEKKSRSNKLRLHKGSIEKDISKTKHSTVLFYKRLFSNFSKLPEYLLSGNRLPISCNRLPVLKFDFKKLLTEFATFQIFLNGVIDYNILVIDYQCIWTLKFKFNCEKSYLFIKSIV